MTKGVNKDRRKQEMGLGAMIFHATGKILSHIFNESQILESRENWSVQKKDPLLASGIRCLI